MTDLKPDLKPWTVLSATQVLRDRWIDVRAERCITATGHIIDPYYMYRRPDWACILAVDEQDRAVVARVYRHGIGQPSLELPGGIIDAEDASPADAVRRELLEETGYACGAISAVARLATNPSNLNSYAHVFYARGARHVQAPQLEGGEVMVTELLPLASLKTLAMTGGIVHGVQVAAILLALEALAQPPR
jgi:8-oxo-dGDP phosphatase